MARQGTMIAYQGQVDFEYQGSGGIGRMLKKAVTGEGVPLMRCRGTGDVFLAQDANELHVLDLDGSDSVTVNGANVLAFEPGLSWDIRRVEGASALSGGVFNMVFSGTGRLVVSTFGTPVVLNTGEAPTYADLQSAIAWSSSLQTRLVRTAGASALIGRGDEKACAASRRHPPMTPRSPWPGRRRPARCRPSPARASTARWSRCSRTRPRRAAGRWNRCPSAGPRRSAATSRR